MAASLETYLDRTHGLCLTTGAYLFFLPIRKTSTNPTIQVTITSPRRKWPCLAFAGIGADWNGG